MATVQVRYIVDDVDTAIEFYTKQLGFRLEMHPAPPFAMLSRGDLRLVLSAPNPMAGGGQSMPDGTKQAPGGWNRFAIEVNDLEAVVERLGRAGTHFRNQIVTGVGGKQIIVEDPSGNPIELFEPTIPEARLEQPKSGGQHQERGGQVTITIETPVKADLGTVWAAWNNPTDIEQWNAASDEWHTTHSAVDLREGGKFSARMEAKDGSSGFDFDGIYTRVEPQRIIEYRMGDGRSVKVEFTETADGVLVRETFEAESENDPEYQRQGWQAILDNFARHVEAKAAAGTM